MILGQPETPQFDSNCFSYFACAILGFSTPVGAHVNTAIGRHARIEQLRAHLKSAGYCTDVQRHYPPIARRILAYLSDQNRSVENRARVRCRRISNKRTLWLSETASTCATRHCSWRIEHAAPPQLLLRLVHGQWPLEIPPTTRREIFHCALLSGYNSWMHGLHGLAATTRNERVVDAKRILDALDDRSDPDLLKDMNTGDVDAYVHDRSAVCADRPSSKSLAACESSCVTCTRAGG